MTRFSKQRSQAAGFTIVEVMIVLAIAGLILLLVFEALPALQHTSRNNQRKQDVATILAAVSHWQLNHSGTFPNPPVPPNPVGSDCAVFNSNCFLFYSNLTYYNPPPATAIQTHLETSPGLPTYGPNTNKDTVDIYNYAQCETGGSATNSGAGYRDTVALYAIETGSSSTASQCQQL
jgi:prepilin-type N-terminal cleavage/methylation domain-containing protein